MQRLEDTQQAHVMCFYDIIRFTCGDWKWGHFRQHCNREYRTGETCGMKLVMQTLPVQQECKHCFRTATALRRQQAEGKRVSSWSRSVSAHLISESLDTPTILPAVVAVGGGTLQLGASAAFPASWPYRGDTSVFRCTNTYQDAWQKHRDFDVAETVCRPVPHTMSGHSPLQARPSEETYSTQQLLPERLGSEKGPPARVVQREVPFPQKHIVMPPSSLSEQDKPIPRKSHEGESTPPSQSRYLEDINDVVIPGEDLCVCGKASMSSSHECPAKLSTISGELSNAAPSLLPRSSCTSASSVHFASTEDLTSKTSQMRTIARGPAHCKRFSNIAQ